MTFMEAIENNNAIPLIFAVGGEKVEEISEYDCDLGCISLMSLNYAGEWVRDDTSVPGVVSVRKSPPEDIRLDDFFAKVGKTPRVVPLPKELAFVFVSEIDGLQCKARLLASEVSGDPSHTQAILEGLYQHYCG